MRSYIEFRCKIIVTTDFLKEINMKLLIFLGFEKNPLFEILSFDHVILFLDGLSSLVISFLRNYQEF